MGNQVTCQNCGAMGEVGSVCAYCGSTISQPDTNAKLKKRRRKTTKDSTDYDDYEYVMFWLRLKDLEYVPDDIFESIIITGVYEFWIPDFVWNESLNCKDKKAHLEQIRQWITDRSFEDNLPHDYPNANKINIYMVDYLYNNQTCWYINFSGPVTPVRELRYYHYTDEINEYNTLNYWITNNCFDLSCELSKFPAEEKYLVEAKKKAIKKARKDIRESIKDLLKLCGVLLFIIIICIFWGNEFFDIDYNVCGLFFVTISACVTVLFIYVIIDWIYDENNSYKKRISQIESGDYLDFLPKETINSHKRERAYWAYRKANPTPISSCTNNYKIL